ncbi:hypothetical protein SDC9_209526 [bioreactor metagenome]|uniref:Solute-binding protein family 3/N-terminal domain-containing protein n=1 Tax=bioreactor metagenome TaxID=1076179 RepID=A0A645JQH1_9ZZZZ
MIEFNDNNKAIMDLERGSVDCLIVDSSLFSYYNKAKAGTFRVLNETLGEEDFAIGFRKGDDAFRAELQKALDKVSASDEGKQIAEKWFGSDILVKK